LGLRPPASRSQMALATARRMMPAVPVMDTAPAAVVRVDAATDQRRVAGPAGRHGIDASSGGA
jgi:hypothetical protein